VSEISVNQEHRLPYEPPRAVDISSFSVNGDSEILVTCRTGTGDTNKCHTGISASVQGCQAGSSATGGGCWTGNSAVGGCTTGTIPVVGCFSGSLATSE